MTDIIMPRGECVYWGCENWTQSSYCREHMPKVCRVCGCEPYGTRGLTYGMCIKHYKRWARKSSQRETILAQDRKRSKRRTEERRAKRAAELERLAEEARAAMPPAERLAEQMEIGGWISGACISGHQRMELVK